MCANAYVERYDRDQSIAAGDLESFDQLSSTMIRVHLVVLANERLYFHL